MISLCVFANNIYNKLAKETYNHNYNLFKTLQIIFIFLLFILFLKRSINHLIIL